MNMQINTSDRHDMEYDITRGYQQCLASVVASLVGNRLPGGVGYKVDESLMNRLQGLLKDGNVDG